LFSPFICHTERLVASNRPATQSSLIHVPVATSRSA